MYKVIKKPTVTVRSAILLLLLLSSPRAIAQRVLTLDECRALALQNNKQMSMAKTKQEITAYQRKSARTKSLPQVSAVGGYIWMSREMSILNDDQKSALNNLGTNVVTSLNNNLSTLAQTLPAAAQAKIAQELAQTSSVLDHTGQGIVNAMRTDTRNMFAGALTVMQPIYMGGAIVSANKMADINEEMASNTLEAKRQNILYRIGQAYWQAVTLRHKEKLAEKFLELVKKLETDVQVMIAEGVATKSDGLSISVKVNEAEMAVTKAHDGLVLSKMLLCQLCGMPVSEQVTLADEEAENIAVVEVKAHPSVEMAAQHRPELKILQNTIDLSRQTTSLLKAANRPQVMLMGGYAISNPNTFNGFERKFGGFFNVGVLVRVPIWNWGDVKYKVLASKGATTIANLELQEAREMIELQVNQSSFRVSEANKRLTMANANIAHAEENLRMAKLGFKEGFATTTAVMEAHTAWLQAQTQRIDAEIEMKLAQVELQKAMGTL